MDGESEKGTVTELHTAHPKWITDDEKWNELKEEPECIPMCDAWWWYATCHYSGQGSKLYEVLSALSLRGYNPGLSVQRGKLDETASDYLALIEHNNGFGWK